MSLIIMKIIEFDQRYELVFLEEDIYIEHPASNYFLKINDLSLNLLISLKWIIWAGKFFLETSKNLEENVEKYPLEEIIDNALQKPLINWKEERQIILIDDNIIYNLEDIHDLLNTFYNKDIFEENTIIHLKLKLNLREYLLISEKIYHPTFIKWESTQHF